MALAAACDDGQQPNPSFAMATYGHADSALPTGWCSGDPVTYSVPEYGPQAVLPDYQIAMAEGDLATLNADPAADVWWPAEVSVDGMLYSQAAVRYRGRASLVFPKKSLKVKLAPEHQFYDPDWGYVRDVFNLNASYTDRTLMREKLSADVMQRLGALAPRAKFVKVFVNGEYAGLYVDVENPRRDFLESRGLDESGALYYSTSSNLSAPPEGSTLEDLFEKELQENGPFTDLDGLVHALNEWSDGDVADGLDTMFDPDALTRVMIGNVIASQTDHINRNFLLYDDEYGTGLWYLLPWDHDLTWGRYFHNEIDGAAGFFGTDLWNTLPVRYGAFSGPGGNSEWGNILYDRYLTSPTHMALFRSALREAVANCVTQEWLEERILAYYLLIHDAVMEDPGKWGDNSEYDTRIFELHQHVAERWQYLQSEAGL